MSQLGVLEKEIGKVGLPGIEPGTSRLSGARSNRLSYKPTKRRDTREKTTCSRFSTSTIKYTREKKICQINLSESGFDCPPCRR